MKAFDDLDRRYRFVRRSRQILMAMIDCVGRAMARLRGGGAPTNKPIDAKRIRRLLLIQLDHLGDAVMTTAMLPAMKRRFPQAIIDVLAAPWNWEVFAASHDVGRIMVSRNNRFRRGLTWLWPAGLVYWAWRLRRARYDLAIDVRGDFLHAALMRAAGIPVRAGWECAGGGWLLSHSAAFEHGRAEVLSRRALLAALGVRPTSQDVPCLPVRPEAEEFVAYLLGDFRRSVRPLVLLHVGAGTRAKTWPVEHWRELLGRLIVDLDAHVILVGADGDRATAAEITQGMFWPGVMDWTGRLNIGQLAALARRSALFVGGDSGPAHVAAAAGARTIVLFSGTNSVEQWRPWGDHVTVLSHAVPCAPCYRNVCPLRDHPCLRELRPERVAEAVDAALHGGSTLAGPHFLKFQPHTERKDRRS